MPVPRLCSQVDSREVSPIRSLQQQLALFTLAEFSKIKVDRLLSAYGGTPIGVEQWWKSKVASSARKLHVAGPLRLSVNFRTAVDLVVLPPSESDNVSDTVLRRRGKHVKQDYNSVLEHEAIKSPSRWMDFLKRVGGVCKAGAGRGRFHRRSLLRLQLRLERVGLSLGGQVDSRMTNSGMTGSTGGTAACPRTRSRRVRAAIMPI